MSDTLKVLIIEDDPDVRLGCEQALQLEGIDTDSVGSAEEAQRRAADRVTLHQVQTIALPKRFSLPMQEIWLLQQRFSSRQRKRVFRLLANPRFRAAFDFLVLRLAASDSHAADVEFWRQAQLSSGDELSANLEAAGAAGDGEGDDAPTRRRRRRRRRPATASAE